MTESDSKVGENTFQVTIPVDTNLRKACLKATYNYVVKEENKRAWRLLIPMGILMVLGGFLAYKQNQVFTFGHIIVFGAGFYFFSIINYFSQVRKGREEYVKAGIEPMNGVENEVLEEVIELTDAHFFFRDSHVSTKAVWSAFANYKLHDDYIFLHYKNSGQIFSLSKAEMGEANFQKAKKIISSKVEKLNGKEEDSKSESDELLYTK